VNITASVVLRRLNVSTFSNNARLSRYPQRDSEAGRWKWWNASATKGQTTGTIRLRNFQPCTCPSPRKISKMRACRLSYSDHLPRIGFDSLLLREQGGQASAAGNLLVIRFLVPCIESSQRQGWRYSAVDSAVENIDFLLYMLKCPVR
jgi:hypothetical protein